MEHWVCARQTPEQRVLGDVGHPVVRTGGIGVLLINVGTPEATSFWAMRRYLKEFLSNPRVVDAKGPLWWFVLNTIILTRKPYGSARSYAKIWNLERNESPLKTIARSQAQHIDMRLKAKNTGKPIMVAWAMRWPAGHRAGSQTVAAKRM